MPPRFAPFPSETWSIHVQLSRRLSEVMPFPVCTFLFSPSALPTLGNSCPSLAWGAVKRQLSCPHLHVPPAWQARDRGSPRTKGTWGRALVSGNDSCSGLAPGSCPQDWQLRTVTYFLAAPNLSNLLAKIPLLSGEAAACTLCSEKLHWPHPGVATENGRWEMRWVELWAPPTPPHTWQAEHLIFFLFHIFCLKYFIFRGKRCCP